MSVFISFGAGLLAGIGVTLWVCEPRTSIKQPSSGQYFVLYAIAAILLIIAVVVK